MFLPSATLVTNHDRVNSAPSEPKLVAGLIVPKVSKNEDVNKNGKKY